MKITNEHLAELRNIIAPVIEANGGSDAIVKQYQEGRFHNSDKTKDLQRRLCFDILYANPKSNKFVCQELYKYLDDTHIYSALKSICPGVSNEA
jgi:hypothetical protein